MEHWSILTSDCDVFNEIIDQNATAILVHVYNKMFFSSFLILPFSSFVISRVAPVVPSRISVICLNAQSKPISIALLVKIKKWS